MHQREVQPSEVSEGSPPSAPRLLEEEVAPLGGVRARDGAAQRQGPSGSSRGRRGKGGVFFSYPDPRTF